MHKQAVWPPPSACHDMRHYKKTNNIPHPTPCCVRLLLNLNSTFHSASVIHWLYSCVSCSHHSLAVYYITLVINLIYLLLMYSVVGYCVLLLKPMLPIGYCIIRFFFFLWLLCSLSNTNLIKVFIS